MYARNQLKEKRETLNIKRINFFIQGTFGIVGQLSYSSRVVLGSVAHDRVIVCSCLEKINALYFDVP
jgi:hypothetical protein